MNTKYLRCGKSIYFVGEKRREVCKSINAAKRRIRELTHTTTARGQTRYLHGAAKNVEVLKGELIGE